MKKFISAFVCLVFLTGCGANSVADCKMILDRRMQSVLSSPSAKADMRSAYIRYYLPPEIGKVDAGNTFHVFNYNGIEFVMNLNINDALQETSEGSKTLIETSGKPFLTKTGLYTGSDGETDSYRIEIYELDRTYVLCMKAGELEFECTGSPLECVNTASEMMKIALSAEIRTDRIRADYIKSPQITHKVPSNSLFESEVPVNGAVKDLFPDDFKADNSNSSNNGGSE